MKYFSYLVVIVAICFVILVNSVKGEDCHSDPERINIQLLQNSTINALKISWITEKNCDQFLRYFSNLDQREVQLVTSKEIITGDPYADGTVYLHTAIINSRNLDEFFTYYIGNKEGWSEVKIIRTNRRMSPNTIIVMSDMDSSSGEAISHVFKEIKNTPSSMYLIVDIHPNCHKDTVDDTKKYAKLVEGITREATYMTLECKGKKNTLASYFHSDHTEELTVLKSKDANIIVANVDSLSQQLIDASINAVTNSSKWNVLITPTPILSPSGLIAIENSDNSLVSKFHEQTDFDLIIAGGSMRYIRTVPTDEFGKSFDPNADTHFNEYDSQYIVYIYEGSDSNAKGLLSDEALKKGLIAKQLTEKSYGVLDVKDDRSLLFSQNSEAGSTIDHYLLKESRRGKHSMKLASEGADQKTLIAYGILIVVILFVIYFIYNWIKCMRSKPQILEDYQESEDFQPKSKKKQMEIGYDMRTLRDNGNPDSRV